MAGGTPDVQLTATVPSNTRFVAASGGITPVNGVLTWNLGNQRPGTKNDDAWFTVKADSGPLATTTATISDSSGQNASNQETTTIYIPQAVTLAGFDAQQVNDRVLVRWETVSELENQGFNLYRGASPDGWDRQLNDALILSQGPGGNQGYRYTWEDRADLVAGQVYYYWLADINLNGAATLHGPVSVEFGAPTAVTLGRVNASPVTGVTTPPWLWVAMAVGMALTAGFIWRRRTI